VAVLSGKLKTIKNITFRSRRERVIVLTTIVVVIVFLVMEFIIFPFIESQQRIQEQIPVKLKQLEKYRQFVAGKEQAEQHLKRVRQTAGECMDMLLVGNTPALAAANLQEILKRLAAKNKIKIHSEKVLDPKSLEFFEQVPVQIDFTSSITNLTSFIYAIETYKKVLTITDLNIRVTNRRSPRDVRATIVVAGRMQGGNATEE
jgi:Tfp pilus assembly protein PilO